MFNVSDGNRSYSEWFDIYDTQMFGEPTMTGFRVDYAVVAWMPFPKPYVPGINDGKMSKKPTDAKDVIWYSNRNYSEIVVKPQKRSE